MTKSCKELAKEKIYPRPQGDRGTHISPSGPRALAGPLDLYIAIYAINSFIVLLSSSSWRTKREQRGNKQRTAAFTLLL
eukprot:scaffold202128_cov35-Tisochrysis_lutea.AAC.1